MIELKVEPAWSARIAGCNSLFASLAGVHTWKACVIADFLNMGRGTLVNTTVRSWDHVEAILASDAVVHCATIHTRSQTLLTGLGKPRLIKCNRAFLQASRILPVKVVRTLNWTRQTLWCTWTGVARKNTWFTNFIWDWRICFGRTFGYTRILIKIKCCTSSAWVYCTLTFRTAIDTLFCYTWDICVPCRNIIEAFSLEKNITNIADITERLILAVVAVDVKLRTRPAF